MSSCCGSVCLLVLLGVVLTFGSPVQFISDNLERTHKSIEDVLELKALEIGSKPLFSSVIRSINTSCQRKDDIQLMNVTLDIYMRIFSNILQHNEHHNTGSQSLLASLPEEKRSQVTSTLTVLRRETEKVKRHLSHPSHNKEDVLSRLNEIKVDDPLAQKKALAEFLEIYHVASTISHRC
uniref:Interferon gamma-related protein n=1 Tax=Oplegnathus fasciatus TaxID=163134 RepID=A0A4Y5WRE3_OPLFA|nr:interferon gamma-related protein [Oplegnathus fasciatus]